MVQTAHPKTNSWANYSFCVGCLNHFLVRCETCRANLFGTPQQTCAEHRAIVGINDLHNGYIAAQLHKVHAQTFRCVFDIARAFVWLVEQQCFGLFCPAFPLFLPFSRAWPGDGTKTSTQHLGKHRPQQLPNTQASIHYAYSSRSCTQMCGP